MEQERTIDQVITKYFFSELSDEEQRQLEDRYFTDSDFQQRMLVVEAELIEAFVRGTLSNEAAAKLKAHMLRSPHQQQKLAFAESLLRVAPEQEPVTGLAAEGKGKYWLLPLVLRYVFTPVAAAVVALAMLSLGAWIVFDLNRLRRELTELQKEQTAAQSRTQILQNIVSELESRKSDSNNADDQNDPQKIESPNAHDTQGRAIPPATSIAVLLSPVLSRSGQELPTHVEILKNTRAVQLQLLYDGEDASSYEALVETADGDELFAKPGLKAARAGNNKIIKLEIPSNLLTNRTYLVTLRTSSGIDLSRYTFAVSKK